MNYIDSNHLKSLCNGDTGFLLKTIDSFSAHLEDAVLKIEGFFSEKKWEEMRSEAHKIKSSAGLMGIKTLKHSLLVIEEACGRKRINTELLSIRIKHLKEIAGKILQELEEEKDLYTQITLPKN